MSTDEEKYPNFQGSRYSKIFAIEFWLIGHSFSHVTCPEYIKRLDYVNSFILFYYAVLSFTILKW